MCGFDCTRSARSAYPRTVSVRVKRAQPNAARTVKCGFLPMQGANEDIASYVATLRGLALSCRFEQLSDSLIRDQIVRCAFNKRIREKLLMKDPNLEEAIQIAKRMEHTAVWLQEMDECNKEGKQNVISEIMNKSKFSV
ncbi:hypothetical protein NDU88_007836 [Pleurodeles waltl]|uniref:Uncharacterized protein n=1 Tax=Pleurodeles waltl TaxID=8319 RepID=A0AAV7PSK7_PLEWA|nr:hypothetical protein NDU88_007836 [Pleurodeles waltl]